MIEATNPPSIAPIAIEEIKAFLRIESGSEDATIAALVRTATGLCEDYIAAPPIIRDVSEIIPASNTWQRLSVAAVRMITMVETLTAGGDRLTLATDGYAIDIDGAGDGWVRATAAAPRARLVVAYSAGLAGDWNGVPEPLRHGIVRLAAHLFTERTTGDAAPPAAVAALWRPYRRMRLT